MFNLTAAPAAYVFIFSQGEMKVKAKHSVKGAGGGGPTETDTQNVKEILRAFTFEEKNEASRSPLFVKLQSALILLAAQFFSGALCRELLEQRHTVGNYSHQSDTCKPYNATSLSFVAEKNSESMLALFAVQRTPADCAVISFLSFAGVCDDAPIL